MRKFNSIVKDFKQLGLKVKDPVTTLVVYRAAHFGLLEKEFLTFGSFYLNEDKGNLVNSDVLGVAEVGHNPPPRRNQGKK
ncbi:hypothetical protein BEN49_03275 [Hymenobacter coccineus]|uniref:Uncharacterized protein n=1 Tax=Hymenobacter coccineus TaxID=1908235 RepID=A0A1G1SSE4_9BACT|nr:hypothetical protein BEN49_03275 [Hymenobacter coccineus]